MKQGSYRAPVEGIKTGAQFLNLFIVKQKKRLIGSVIFGTLATLITVSKWLLLAYLCDLVITQSYPIEKTYLLIGILMICAVLHPLLVKQQTQLAQKANRKIKDDLRKSLLLEWGYTNPFSIAKISPGKLASLWIEDVEAMDGYFEKYYPQQLLSIISPVIILSVVFYLNWLCGLFLLISAPLIPLFMILVGLGAEQVNQKYSLIRQRLSGHFLDRISHLATIKQLNANLEVSDEIASQGETYRAVIMKSLRIAFLSSTVLEFFSSVAIATVAIYIGFSLYGAITWGPATSLTLFSGLSILLLAPEFFRPLKNLATYYHDKANALGGANNIIKQQQQLQSSEVAPNNFIFSTGDSSINIFELVVGFDQTPVTHKPINFYLTEKSLLVISGQSGTGKTTLLNTIMGNLKPISGYVELFSNTNGAIGYLPQKPWIKNASVRDNILCLAPMASDDDIINTLKGLGLDEEILSSQDGLNTMLGEHGQGLSGGQMQRIALARALLNPYDVILLDEPTASLDVSSRLVVIEAIKKLKNSSIVICATHDPLLIEAADSHISLDREDLVK